MIASTTPVRGWISKEISFDFESLLPFDGFSFFIAFCELFLGLCVTCRRAGELFFGDFGLLDLGWLTAARYRKLGSYTSEPVKVALRTG